MRMGILIFGLAILLAGTPVADAQQVVDRIVVRIENDIITLSEVRELGQFQQLASGAGAQGQKQSEDELIELLINQWIVNEEATAAHYPQPAKEAVQQEVERLTAQFGSAENYRARLRELGLTEASVNRHVARQVFLASYLDYKLRPVSRVDDAQVEKYYREELAPELKKRGQEAPELDSVDGQIRELLTQRDISMRAAKWLDDTRARLHIERAGKKSTP